MSFLVAALAGLLALQGFALLARLPGLLPWARGAPRPLGLLPALAAIGSLGWAAEVSVGAAVAGFPVGALLAALLASLRPMRPDSTLLGGGAGLPIAGHPDAQAVLLTPATPRRTTVVVAHGGGNDRSFALWEVVPRMLAQGHAVVLFHLPGHGEGGEDLLDLTTLRGRLDAVLASARASAPAPLVALGQSLGGSTVLDAVCRGAPLDAAITVSALTSLSLGSAVLKEAMAVFHAPIWKAFRHGTFLEVVPAAGPLGRGRYPVRTRRANYLEEFRDALEEMDLGRRLASAPNVPLLIIHGSKDAIVPVTQARAIAEAAGKRARFLEIPGMRHLDPLFDEQTIGAVLEFLDSVGSRR